MTFFHASFADVARRWHPDASWTGQTAHRHMGAYFQRAACPKRLGQWAAAPSRALSELSYQRRWDTRQRYREHLFSDVRFVAASIASGLLNELVEDLEEAKVPLMRDAVLSALGAIQARPELTQVIVVNRLRNQTLPPVLAAYVKRAEAEMDRRGMWIRAQTPFSDERTVAGVVSVTPLRGAFHAVADGRFLGEYDLASFKLIGRRMLPPGVNEHTIVIDPVKDRVAWTDGETVYLNGERVPLKLRYPPHCLSFFGGLVGIDEAHALLWLDTERRTTSILATDISPSYARIMFAPDCQSGVLIDGDRPPTQRILLLRIEAGMARAIEWLRPSLPVCSACLNEDASVIVLATRNRHLKMYDVRSGSLLREADYRIASGSAVRGVAQECCALTADGHLHCLLATCEGELLAWDTATDKVRRRGAYSGLREPKVLRVLEPIPAYGRFVVATAEWIQTLSPAGEDITASKAPITQCSYWADGWLVVATEAAKSVTWFEKNAWRNDYFIANYEPVTVALHGNGGATYVGYKNGSIIQLEPGQKPGSEDALDLFDHAVCAVMPMENGRVLAVSERGEIKIARFRPADVDRIIPHIENLREEQFLCCLGERGDFVSCGRCQAGDAHTSIVVVRNDGSRETVLETKHLAVALSAGSDGATVYVALQETVLRYHRRSGHWINEGERKASVEAMRGTGNGMLVVTRRDQGCGWLEIWSDSEDMRTVATAELPLVCTSLSGASSVIAAGSMDGRHCLMEVRNQAGGKNEALQARR